MDVYIQLIPPLLIDMPFIYLFENILYQITLSRTLALASLVRCSCVSFIIYARNIAILTLNVRAIKHQKVDVCVRDAFACDIRLALA